MTSRITALLVIGVVALGTILGFSINDNPYGSKSNTTSTETPIINPPTIDAAYYTDHFDDANDTTALKARGYKVWYRGGGVQGAGATWFQGNTAVFNSFEGPATGYVACNYQVVTGLNNIDSWLVLPRLNVAAGDTLSYWCRSTDVAATNYPDSFRVMYSSVGDSIPEAASWVELGRYKAVNAPYVRIAYRAPTAGANARFAIRYNVVNGGPLGDNSDYAGIDFLNVSSGGAPPSCAYSWATQTSGTVNPLLTVSAVSNLVGWAAGNGATVRRTTDGGSTWGNGNSTPGVITGDIYNIYAWSANDAICTTSPGATFIYKTTNGGTTWTQVYTLAGGFLDGLEMVSATEGYGLGDPVGGKWTVVKTTDGGSTWARMATEPVQVGAEAGLNNSFYASGTNMWFNTSVSTVYHSTNSGVNWSFATLTGVTTTTYGSVHFNSSTLGLASGSAGIARSTDGGATYTSAGTIPGTGNITALDGNTNDFWFARGTDIYRSTNGGLNYTLAHTAVGGFNDLDFAPGACPVGWAVTATGTISKMSTLTGINPVGSEIPASYLLKQNFPNPFNPTTNINFSIPKTGLVTLKIYDMVGKEVATLVNEVKSAGNYIIGFSAANLPSGAYFYRIETNGFVDTKKMLLIK